jgi:peptide/nickel transport system substrate-binding protein
MTAPTRPRPIRNAPHTRRVTLIVAAFIVAIVASGAALALRLSGNDTVIGGGGTYSEAVAGQWGRINPLFANTNDADADLSQLIFSGLVRLGPDGAVEADLADLPQISDDGTTYTFTLRKDLKWHDGEPVTSADVAFTVARLTDPDFKGDPALAEGWLGVDVKTPDARTVVVKLKQASAPFLARSATIGIIPQHLLGQLSATELEAAPFNSAPVGTGPYKLQAIDSHEATLVANNDYYLGRPGLGTIKLRFYPDYSSAVRALAAGDVKGLMVREALTETQLTDLRKIKGMKIEQPQRGDSIVLYLTHHQAAYFQDARVRRAISLALDRQDIVDKVFFGVATPSSSAIAPGTWAYAKDYDQASADITQAKQLLDQAGWKPHPTTGILLKDGAEFRFTIRTDNDPTRVAIANEIAHQLEPLGIRATVASTTFSVLRRDFLQERKYDAAVTGWAQGPDPDPYFGWHSSQGGLAGLNLANFADTVADELIAKGRTTNDTDVRKDVYRQFQEVWSDLSPSVVIAYPQYVYAHTDALQGVNTGVLFTGSLRFTDVYKWHE